MLLTGILNDLIDSNVFEVFPGICDLERVYIYINGYKSYVPACIFFYSLSTTIIWIKNAVLNLYRGVSPRYTGSMVSCTTGVITHFFAKCVETPGSHCRY